MQLQLMPAKTEQGRAEIESRSRKLPGGLRSVLLLVDGRRTVAELQELAKRLNAPEDALQQLLSLELISGEMADARPSIGEPANEPIGPREKIRRASTRTVKSARRPPVTCWAIQSRRP